MRNKHTVIKTLALLALATTLFAGCGKSGGPATSTTTSTNAAGRQFVIGMSQCNLGEPWRVQMNADIRGRRRQAPRTQSHFQRRPERYAPTTRPG